MHAADLNIALTFAFAIVHVNGKPFLKHGLGRFPMKGKFFFFFFRHSKDRSESKKISQLFLFVFVLSFY